MNSANSAAKILREQYPERKIHVIDSLGASSGYGLIMDKAADLRDAIRGTLDPEPFLAISRDTVQVLDCIRRAAGIVFPSDGEPIDAEGM